MAKKASEKPARKPRAKQGYLADMEPPSIPELDQAAENYYDAVQERLPLTKAEAEAKDTLITAMVKHGQTRYEFDGFVVTLTDSKNVQVKPKKEPKVAPESNGDTEE